MIVGQPDAGGIVRNPAHRTLVSSRTTPGRLQLGRVLPNTNYLHLLSRDDGGHVDLRAFDLFQTRLKVLNEVCQLIAGCLTYVIAEGLAYIETQIGRRHNCGLRKTWET